MLRTSPTLFSGANTAPAASPPPPTVTVKPIPYFPSMGDIADIEDKVNCKLVPDSQFDQINQDIQIITSYRVEIEDDRFSKHDLGTKFNIVRKGGELHAVYELLGTGATGRVKAVQNLRSGKWRAMKIIPVAPQGRLSIEQRRVAEKHVQYALTEYENLILLGQSSKKEAIGKRDSAIKNPRNLPTLRKDKNEIQWNLFMDLAEGLPLNYLTDADTADNYALPTLFWLTIALDFIQVVKEFHKNEIHPMVHCDIKTDNFVYHLANKQMKMIDFARALLKNKEGYCQSDFRGSFIHWTPEIRRQWRDMLLKQGNGKKSIPVITYNDKTDIHALLIMLAEIFRLFEAPPEPQTNEEFEKYIKTFDPNVTHIVGKNHPLFIFNNRLDDPAIRQEVLDFLIKSTTGDPEQTPTIEAIAEFFEKIKAKCLLSSPKIKVGILDINQYLQCHKEEKQNLVSAIQSMNEIQLTDNASRTDFEYMQVKWELEQSGLHVVANNVYISPDKIKLQERIQSDYNAGKLKDCYEFHDTRQLLADYKPAKLQRSDAVSFQP